MWGQLLVQSVVILWMVQAAYTRGYGAAAGVSNGHGPQLNGNHPPNSGVGRFLIPSKGVGAHGGYGGYPTKGIGYGPAVGLSSANGAKSNGYGAAAGGTHGYTKGYGAAAGGTNGHGGISHGHGAQAGPVNGLRVKGNGHGAQAGGFGGQGTKGIGYGAAGGALGLNGAKGNGHGAAASAQYGFGTKGNGQGAVAGPSNYYGAQHKPMKGYGRPPYGSVKGPGVGMGAFRGLGTRNPGKAYSRNGYNGYGAQPVGGYNGGYGRAGLGLGSQYGLKGPKKGHGGAAAAQPSGQRGKPKGYGNIPSGFGAKQKGYGAMRPQTGYGTATGADVPKPHGAKPNGYGLALGGHGSQLNGYGAGSKPQTAKGVGAASPSQGYDGADVVQSGQIAKAANSGYGKAPKTTGASNDPRLYVLSPEQLNPAPLGVVPQPAISQGLTPPAPEPTRGVLVRVTPEQHLNLLSPVPQGKSYKQLPQASSEHLPVYLRGKGPKTAPQPTPEPAHMGLGGPAAVFTQGNPPPEPAVVLPEGYVTGSAVPEQKGAEDDVLFGVDRPAEGDAAPESTEPLKTRLVPELVAAKSTESITPEETLTLSEANIKTQPEAGPDRLGVKGHPAGEAGAMGVGGASVTKAQGAEPSKPDCDPSVPNGQWMKIPRPGLKAGAGASAGTVTKGYSAGAGGYPNGGGANKPAYGTGGLSVPGLVPGYGAGLGHPYAGKPKQPGYGQGANLGAGYENGNSHKGYGNGFRAGVQPDYASLGQSAPSIDGKSGVSPYNGAKMVPAGLDGMSQFEPQSAGLGLNGKPSSVYGGLGYLPFGGHTLGAEKSNSKYGIGGLQFAGQPFSSASNGAGKYGGLGAGVGGVPVPVKYGYGRLAYQAQPVALSPEIKSTGKYGLPASPHQPEHPGFGHSGKLGKYGGGEVANALQGLGGEAKSPGKYDNQGEEQPLESASEGRSTGQYGAAGLPYQPLPVEPDSAGKPYVKGEVPAPASAAGGEGMPGGGYDNVGYINGQVQPEAVAFSPTLTYPSVPSYLIGESHLTSEVTPEADPAGAASLNLDSAPAIETRGELQVPEQPDERLQQQLPRQIHIQQHLKLHFHPKNKSWRGTNNEKHDLKGFFGNSGYQG